MSTTQYACSVSSKDLPNMLKFNPGYVKAMRSAKLKRGTYVSAEFAEWLFGFPKGYTNEQALETAVKNRPKREGREKVVSLFSGIDGLSLMLEEWFEVVLRCDCKPESQRLLAARQKDGTLDAAELTDDVGKLAARTLIEKGATGLFAGWPCQGNSCAGAQEGLADARTGLFKHIVRLANEAKLDFVFLENVAGLLGKNLAKDTMCTCP